MSSPSDAAGILSATAPATVTMATLIRDACMIVTCNGPSDCLNCVDRIYRPILGRMEDSECTGLVIDKRGIDCSRGKKSLDKVAQTILLHTHRSPLRKLAIVTTIDYKKDEQLLLETLYKKGVNIRLFTDLDLAVSWTASYP